MPTPPETPTLTTATIPWRYFGEVLCIEGIYYPVLWSNSASKLALEHGDPNIWQAVENGYKAVQPSPT